MLGRHVYRVHPAEDRWTVTKEGESGTRGNLATREEALGEARWLAEADQPSKVIIDDGEGVILDEQVFGSDLNQELDSTPR